MCMEVSPAWSVNQMYAVPMQASRGWQIHWKQSDVYELPYGEPNLGLLKEQQMLITAKKSLQPLIVFL